LSGSRIFRKICRGLLLWVCTTLIPGALSASDLNSSFGQYIVTRWNSGDSFPGGAINAIAQTPDGYLWIGGENGLVRFDGINFRLFDSKNAPSLPPGQVLGLVVDSDGALWAHMESPNLMRYRDGSFEQMYDPVLPEWGATAIALGTDGHVIIVANGRPYRYAGGKFTPIVSPVGTGGLGLAVAETADGAAWIGSPDGLTCVRAEGRSQVMALSGQKVGVLQAGSGPELWIGTDAGLVRWDGAAVTHRGVPSALTRNEILALLRDRDSNLWVSISNGMARLDSNGSVVQGAPPGAPGVVRAMFEDREGSIWLGGSEGLVQLRKPLFQSYYGAAGSGGPVYVDASGRAWTGPSSGGLLWVRGGEQHSVTGLGLEDDVIYSISGGPDELWLGRKRGGVTKLREEDGVFHSQTYTVSDGLAPGVVSAVHRARDGAVWVGTLGGAVSRIQAGRVTTFISADGLSSDAVTTIEDTADGVVWIGTTGGLQAFRNGSRRRYGGGDGLPPGRVNSLALDEEGIMWIGCSAGIFHWSGTRLESARSVPDSLQGEIYGLAADGAGNLWAATDRRVVRISRSALLGQSTTPTAVREIGTADGLPSTRGIRRDRSIVKDTLGRIWLSLQGGLCVQNPSRLAAQAPALVNVESVMADGRPLVAGTAARYSSSRQRIVFSFIGVSLAVPGRVRYRCMLDGYDRDWSQPSDAREKDYTNLPPARYTFRVMASNSEGLWNGAPAVVAFTVEPQFWQTWWFQTAGFFLGAAAIFAGLRYRVAHVRAAMNLRFEERLLERARIARELHDTLLQSFQGLMLRLQVVNDLLPPGRAREKLEQTLERADQAIAEGRRAVYGLRSSNETRNDLAEMLRAAANDLIADRSTAFRLEIKGRSRDLHPILRDEVCRIACEGLRNAFTHAEANLVSAEIAYADKLFRLRIRDNGKGIPAES
jgi:ligand-binding sensor domain-containing protein/signal transduction histidine kinase